MNRRSLVTVLVLVVAGFISVAVFMNFSSPPPAPPGSGAAPAPAPGTVAAPADASAVAPAVVTPAPAATVAAVKGLHVVTVTAPQDEPVIGDVGKDEKDNPYMMRARFTPYGGGIKEIALSRYSVSLDKYEPYIVQERLIEAETTAADGSKTATYRYPFAAYTVSVNGSLVYLYHERWQAGPVTGAKGGPQTASFSLELADGDDNKVLRITRTWTVEPGSYDLKLSQKLENLGSGDLNVQFTQYGQGDLPYEESSMGDMRHVLFAYNQPRTTDTIIVTSPMLTKHEVMEGPANKVLWPIADDDPRHELLWSAVTNRYFVAALHPPVTAGRPIAALRSQFTSVRRFTWGPADPMKGKVMLVYDTPVLALRGGGAAAQEMTAEVYIGPRDPRILGSKGEYAALQLNRVIVYNLGGFCTNCTFDSVAQALLWFLTLLHTIFGDWGVAIICLVAVVRALLHPLTKSAQVNMMKMSKAMQAIQPEVEKLKAKYANDQPKLNAEMMALYKKRGVNPAAMGLGCLPMFLQMPIWIALYAMLFYAIELRHEPAFYGVFQLISGGHWPFLADLSAPDNGIPLPEAVQFMVPLFGHKLTHVNLLPILMAFVFFIQQKYMQAVTPPANEQVRQQQAIMKWMVLLFPLFLYWSPSGLTLYILASTSVGIIESMRVRAHLKELEAQGKLLDSEPGFISRMLKRFLGPVMDAAQKRMESANNDGLSGNVRRKKRD